MQKKFVLSYFLIFFSLLAIMSLSHSTTERIRGNFIALMAPIWDRFSQVKTSPPLFAAKPNPLLALQEEVYQLRLENQLLTQQQDLTNSLKEKDSTTAKTFVLPARVIFRSLDSWGHVLWINLGEINNQATPIKVIAKHSPVLMGDTVIGMIDYVGQQQSRVRLITDASLILSVRAVRGGEQEAFLAEHVAYLLQALQTKKLSTISKDEGETVTQLLTRIQSELDLTKKTWYLAKGELQGCVSPFAAYPMLKGTGFNYDFSDEKGEARDLRTGRFIHDSQSSPIPILKQNDLLVTTGMDGIFPAGLKVAIVTKIKLLKEGDYFYELEAKPAAGNLNELSRVFVIPPLGYHEQDEP